MVEDSLTTLLHHACDRGNLELISILLGLDQGLEKAQNTNGLSPLHLAVLRGPVVVLEEFLEKAPLSFSSLTRSKETVFHLAARNKNVDAFIFMAERLSINNQKLMRQVDVNGNTVLHIAVSMSCGAPVSSFLCRCQFYNKSKKSRNLVSAYIRKHCGRPVKPLFIMLAIPKKMKNKIKFASYIISCIHGVCSDIFLIEQIVAATIHCW